MATEERTVGGSRIEGIKSGTTAAHTPGWIPALNRLISSLPLGDPMVCSGGARLPD